MSGASAARSTTGKPIRSFTQFVASGFAVLLAKTLRSSTLKLALISIGIFRRRCGWSLQLRLLVHRFLRAPAARTAPIAAEQQPSATRAYDGRPHRARRRNGSASPTSVSKATRLPARRPFLSPRSPAISRPGLGPRGTKGWATFGTPEWGRTPRIRRCLRAAFETLAGRVALLVGEDLGGLDEVRGRGSNRPSPWASR